MGLSFLGFAPGPQSAMSERPNVALVREEHDEH